MPFIDPQKITLTDGEGRDKDYIISKIPAIPAREIVAKYPLSALPKLGDYEVNEATMLKLLTYAAAVSPDGIEIPLTTRELINNHCRDWEILAKLEYSILEYNVSFLKRGGISSFLETIIQKAQPWATKILTDSLGQFSRPAGRRSKS